MVRVAHNQWTLGDSLLMSAETNPSGTAVVADGHAYSYERLLDTAARLANALGQHGVGRGDRVAIFMDNSWMAVVGIYAAALADAVFIVLHPQMKADKLSFVLRDSGARALLTQGRLEAVATAAAASADTLRLIAAADARRTDRALLDLDGLVRGASPTPPKRNTIPTDLAALVYTSGSTADPRG